MEDGAKASRVRRLFFANSALVTLALILTSFSVTYFVSIATGSQQFPILFHVHAAELFSWIVLCAYQTRRVATGRVARHRELGLAGVALSSVMAALGLALAIAAARCRAGHHELAP